MNYFDAIVHRCEQLDALGQAYLDKFDFIPSDEMAERIWNAAKVLFDAAGEDWDKIPEWAATCMDGYVPYTPGGRRNGSIYYALGFSIVSRDAHLRNLLEIAEGRTTEELDFPVLAEKEIVDKLSS